MSKVTKVTLLNSGRVEYFNCVPAEYIEKFVLFQLSRNRYDDFCMPCIKIMDDGNYVISDLQYVEGVYLSSLDCFKAVEE